MKRFVLALAFLCMPCVGHSALPHAPGTPFEIAVRQTDLDANLHVNNARYVEYLQCGRWDWLEKHGLPRERLHELKAVPVVVGLTVNFRKECRQGDTLSVVTSPEKVGEKSFVFTQEVRKPDGAVAADATVTLVAFDPTARVSRVLPEELRQALAKGCCTKSDEAWKGDACARQTEQPKR